jgi:maleamate amidohydrolase
MIGTPVFGGTLGRGSRPALLLVDLMRAYFTTGSPLDLQSTASLEGSAELLTLARRRRVPVAHSVVHYRAGGVDAGLFIRKVPALQVLADGAPGGLREPMPEVAPLDDEILVVKQYASAFFGSSLASTLHTLGIDTLVIGGVSTSGCIRATATDALQHGFRPLVVDQACGDRNEELHRSNLRDLNAKYADVVSLPEAVAYLGAIDHD